MSLLAPGALRPYDASPAGTRTTPYDRSWLVPEGWTLPTVLHWVLRIAMLWCFVGHGAFGVMGKEAWLPYYHVFGIPDSLAWHTMPVIGAVDITIGIVTLFRPMRAVLVYAIGWTVLTALLRPLAGEGLWQEVAERGGNFGIPIALLILVGLGDRSVRSWFEFARPREITDEVGQWLAWSLRLCIAALLIGHGGFGVTHLHDKAWTSYLGVLGVGSSSVGSAQIVAIGLFEIALGVAVLVKPWRELLMFVLVWKLFTELLRPLSGEPIFEFIERGGDLFLPLALIFMQLLPRKDEERFVAPMAAPVGGPALLQAHWSATTTVPGRATTFVPVPAANGNGHHNGVAPHPAAEEELRRAAEAITTRLAVQRERARRVAAAGRSSSG